MGYVCDGGVCIVSCGLICVLFSGCYGWLAVLSDLWVCAFVWVWLFCVFCGL